ncbi:MAG TPA: hypothetical protein VGI87_02930 [Solirubrobacteraceae bacterium]
MHLVFDIFQGMGVAAAIGIRPFLPALVVGALAAGNVEIHFNGTSWDFLQQGWFFLVLVVLVMALALIERRMSEEQLERGPVGIAIAGCALALGALFFAASLARGHYAAWPGIIGGIVCAAIGIAATRPLFVRVRQRLDAEAAAAVPLYFEGAAVLFALLSVVAPPLGLIGVVLLVWLLVAGRRRADQKYAGLRILR